MNTEKKQLSKYRRMRRTHLHDEEGPFQKSLIMRRAWGDEEASWYILTMESHQEICAWHKFRSNRIDYLTKCFTPCWHWWAKQPFYMPVWKTGRIMPWQCPSVRVFQTFLQHALRYQFETWYIHSVGGTTCRVWVASQLGLFDRVYSQK